MVNFARRREQLKERNYCLDTVLHLNHYAFINSAEMKDRQQIIV